MPLIIPIVGGEIMPYIKVNINRIDAVKSNIAYTRAKVGNIKSSFYSTGSSLDWDVKACAQINSQINKINNELSNEIESLKRMESFLSMAIQKYKEVDKKRNVITVRTAIHSAKSVISNKSSKVQLIQKLPAGIKPANRITLDSPALKTVVDFLKKVAKKGGTIGGVYGILSGEAAFIEKIRNMDYSGAFKSWAGVDKGVYKTISGLITKNKKMAKVSHLLTTNQKVKNWAKFLTGTEDYIKAPSKASKLTTRWYNNYQKIKTKFDPVGSITVADVVISGVANIIDNVSDYAKGDMSVERTIAEIAGETAIDVAKDAIIYFGATAITTWIGAGVVAAVGGTVAVPGIVIAGVSVGIVALANWGLNAMAKHFTNGEKDFTEWASDGLLDIGEKIGKAATNAYHTIAPKVKEVCNVIAIKTKTAVNNVVDSAKNVIGNAKSVVGNIFSSISPIRFGALHNRLGHSF